MLQSRNVSGRSSLSPAENSAITSAASARCSISSASPIGSIQSMSSTAIATAAPAPSVR